MAEAEAPPPVPKARGRAAALAQRLASSAKSSSKLATSIVIQTDVEAAPNHDSSTSLQLSNTPNIEVNAEPETKIFAPQTNIIGDVAKVGNRGSRKQTQIQYPPKKYAGDDAGKIFPTEVNYLRVNCDLPDGGLFQHHVSFEPDIENYRQRGQIMNLKEVVDVMGTVSSFDGGSALVLPRKLEDSKIITKNPLTGHPVVVFINFTNIIEIGNMPFFFNRVIKDLMNALTWMKVGKDSHYYNPAVRYELRRHCLEIWPGFATSCKRGQDGSLLVELDVCTHVLRSDTVMDLFRAIEQDPSTCDMKNECLRKVLNMIVTTRYNNKTYKVEDIDWEKNPLSTFQKSDGTEVTFMDYYRGLGVQIKDRMQPLLISKQKDAKWNGARGCRKNEAKYVCLVPELCYMTGLSDSQRSDYVLMRDVGEYTRLTPFQRVGAIRKFLDSITKNEKCQEILSNWRISFSLDLVKVDGHLYAPETIFTGGDKNPAQCGQYQPGDFSEIINKARPLRPASISKWAVIYARNSQREANDFIDQIMQTGKQVSVEIDQPTILMSASPRSTDLVQAVRSVTSQNPKKAFLVVILPSRSDDHYIAVKKECNEIGIPSQMIVAQTLKNVKKFSSICRRIFLQIEAKLGAELWGVAMPPAGLMVMGLDVYHDPSGRQPSWVALVGSLNQEATRYYNVATKQLPGEEAGHGIALSAAKLLNAYRQTNGVLPKKIFVYRDGLSASQFRVSREFELKQIRQAFTGMGEDYNPDVVVIVCVKRIGARIFAPLQKDGYTNPPPGLAVDRVIGARNYTDFFLISQNVRQGAVTPTHYVVVEDGSHYSASQLQRLTWKLTHLYYNSPVTVRSPAPVVYADRLAAMVGQVLHAEPHANLMDKLFYL